MLKVVLRLKARCPQSSVSIEQGRALEVRGECTDDDADLHVSTCFALRMAMKYIVDRPNLFRHKLISIVTDDEVLIRVVNNHRKKSRRMDHFTAEYESKKLFDKTRDEVYPSLLLEHNDSRTLPWVDMADKIAADRNHGQRARRPWIPLVAASLCTLQQNIPLS